jgi:hypothetical protein
MILDREPGIKEGISAARIPCFHLYYLTKMTRMRVPHFNMGLIPVATGRKSRDQRKPSGKTTPRHLSLLNKSCVQSLRAT